MVTGVVSMVIVILVYTWFYAPIQQSAQLGKDLGGEERLIDHNTEQWDTMTIALIVICALVIIMSARDEDYPSKSYGGP